MALGKIISFWCEFLMLGFIFGEDCLILKMEGEIMADKESLDCLEKMICDQLGLEVDFGKTLDDFKEERVGKENCSFLPTELEAEYDTNLQLGIESDNEVQQDLLKLIKEQAKNKKEELTAQGIVTEEMRVKRVQKGFFHVWFRGGNRYNVFYEETDYIGFLERCKTSASKNKTAITAFVLMNNHVHLQIYTHTLNKFMKSLLISFSQWYNYRKDMDGQVFKSPFSSSPIYSRSALERNLLYIFTNPVRAGMCLTAEEYKWSSFHFAKKGYYNPIKNFIDVELAAMEYLYKSKSSLAKSTQHFVSSDAASVVTSDASTSAVANIGSANMANKSEHKIKLCKPNDTEVAIYLRTLLGGKNLRELSEKELSKIIKVLKHNQNATYRQISSLTHESYTRVKKLSGA